MKIPEEIEGFTKTTVVQEDTMSLSHFSIHRLERAIADVLEKGFSPKMNAADCLQAGHDVVDYILEHYRIEPHPYAEDDISQMPLVPGSLLEEAVNRRSNHKSLVQAVTDLKRLLREPKNGLELAISPVMAAGMGGGMGEDVR